MQSLLRTAVVLSVLAAAGCATHTPRPTGAPVRELATQGQRIAVDDDYVGRVNQKAQRRGLQVQWVNPPMRRIRQD